MLQASDKDVYQIPLKPQTSIKKLFDQKQTLIPYFKEFGNSTNTQRLWTVNPIGNYNGHHTSMLFKDNHCNVNINYPLASNAQESYDFRDENR